MNLPLNIDVQQILLHALNFVILAGGLYLLLYNPVKKFMDNRTAAYEKADAEIAEKLQQAEALRTELQGRLDSADAEIAQKSAERLAAADQDAQARLRAADEKADAIVAEARTQAGKEKEQIIASAAADIEALAEQAAEKLMQSTLQGGFDSFLDAAEEQHE